MTDNEIMKITVRLEYWYNKRASACNIQDYNKANGEIAHLEYVLTGEYPY